MLPRDWSRWATYIRNKTAFYIRDIFQWDDVDLTDLDNWIANFPDELGKYIAMQLLYRFIYWSERDVKRLLRHGVYKVLLYSAVLDTVARSRFDARAAARRRFGRELLATMIFCPLLDRNKPSESGNVLCRHLNRDIGIISDQIVQPFELAGFGRRGVVILDDFIGSGQQIIDFWTKPKTQGEALCDLAAKNDLNVAYLCLVATRYGLNRIYREAPGLKVLCCEELDDTYRVFHVPSSFFGSEENVREAREYLNRLCASRDVPLLGFHGLDFAVAFHYAIPDATLPLFFYDNVGWKPLMRRRKG